MLLCMVLVVSVCWSIAADNVHQAGDAVIVGQQSSGHEHIRLSRRSTDSEAIALQSKKQGQQQLQELVQQYVIATTESFKNRPISTDSQAIALQLKEQADGVRSVLEKEDQERDKQQQQQLLKQLQQHVRAKELENTTDPLKNRSITTAPQAIALELKEQVDGVQLKKQSQQYVIAKELGQKKDPLTEKTSLLARQTRNTPGKEEASQAIAQELKQQAAGVRSVLEKSQDKQQQPQLKKQPQQYVITKEPEKTIVPLKNISALQPRNSSATHEIGDDIKNRTMTSTMAEVVSGTLLACLILAFFAGAIILSAAYLTKSKSGWCML